MNKYCYKECKHKGYCRLNKTDTNACKNSDAELDKAFSGTSGSIFGMTTKEIAAKQGMRVEDLNK